jgi:hypothetical protein
MMLKHASAALLRLLSLSALALASALPGSNSQLVLLSASLLPANSWGTITMVHPLVFLLLSYGVRADSGFPNNSVQIIRLSPDRPKIGAELAVSVDLDVVKTVEVRRLSSPVKILVTELSRE